MQLNPYLAFNGECEAAFKFYERCVGGKIVMMLKNGESPMADQTPPDRRDQIMHARLVAGDAVLMGSDAPPGHYEKAKGIMVTLGVEDPAEAERIFAALSEQGSVQMAIQETFWASRFGMLTDRFGIPWMVNCEKPE
ncbi:MAG TPA: VOC family protein [Stellaceae bacterium]|jgi:PhnB protein